MRPNILNRLTLSEEAVNESIATIRNTLIRLRLTQKTPQDLAVLAVYFGIGWLLSNRMEDTEGLRNLFARLLKLLTAELKTTEPFSAACYDACADVLETFKAFLSNVTPEDMREAEVLVHRDGSVPLLDEFLNEVTDPNAEEDAEEINPTASERNPD